MLVVFQVRDNYVTIGYILGSGSKLAFEVKPREKSDVSVIMRKVLIILMCSQFPQWQQAHRSISFSCSFCHLENWEMEKGSYMCNFKSALEQDSLQQNWKKKKPESKHIFISDGYCVPGFYVVLFLTHANTYFSIISHLHQTYMSHYCFLWCSWPNSHWFQSEEGQNSCALPKTCKPVLWLAAI